MGRSKKKSNKIEVVENKKAIIKTSEECIKCNHKCDAGQKYIKLIESGKRGNGVVCRC